MRSLSYGYLAKIKAKLVALGYRFLTSGISPSDPTMLRTLVLANALLFITSLARYIEQKIAVKTVLCRQMT